MDALLAAYGSDSGDGDSSSSSSDDSVARGGGGGGGGTGEDGTAAKRPRLAAHQLQQQQQQQPCVAAATAPPAKAVRLPNAAALLGGGEGDRGRAEEQEQRQRQRQQQQQLRSAAVPSAPPPPPRQLLFEPTEGMRPLLVFVPVPERLVAPLQSLAALVSSQLQAHTGARLWPAFAAAGAAGRQQTEKAGVGSAYLPAGASAAAEEPAPASLPPHVSLSRTVPVSRTQSASLHAALARQLRHARRFDVVLHGLECLVNDNGSRSFVGVRVANDAGGGGGGCGGGGGGGAKRGGGSNAQQQRQGGKRAGGGVDGIVRLIEAVDRAFALHGLPAFHERPLPHVSLAWAEGDAARALRPHLEAVEAAQQQQQQQQQQQRQQQQQQAAGWMRMEVAQVVVQWGNARAVVWDGGGGG